ncbi:MAG: hypothetical protein QOI82_3053 [Actinomycetota bacterium]|jgi:hypothetical protein|nr:hypothetical protein [Actinomycetota bacterium]
MARTAGFSVDGIRARRDAEWQDLRRGTYACSGIAPGPVMRAAAAVLAAGGSLRPLGDRDEPPRWVTRSDWSRGSDWTQWVDPADQDAPLAQVVAAGRTAARVWEIPLVDDEDPATERHEAHHDDVLRTEGRCRTGTLHSRRARFDATSVVHVQGVPVLSPLQTVVDLAVVLRPDALVAALDHVFHTELVALPVVEALSAANRRGEDGAVALRNALGLTDPKAESPHESLTRLVLKPVLPELESQVRVLNRHGWLVARLDLGDRALRLGVESDGAAYHRGRAAADRRRDSRTGWTIERVSWYETRREQEQLRRRVLATADGLRNSAAA